MAATCAFDRIARKAGISTTRLHDLRHTPAATLLVAGVDVRTAAGVLGHASPSSTTLSTYAHLMPEAQRDAVDRLSERLERLVGGSSGAARQPNLSVSSGRSKLHNPTSCGSSCYLASIRCETTNRKGRASFDDDRAAMAASVAASSSTRASPSTTRRSLAKGIGH